MTTRPRPFRIASDVLVFVGLAGLILVAGMLSVAMACLGIDGRPRPGRRP